MTVEKKGMPVLANYGPFSRDHVPSCVCGAYLAVICGVNLTLSAKFAAARETSEYQLFCSDVALEVND